MNENAVEMQGITRRFGDVLAVDKIDLAIPRGEIYGFLGPNGAGKTTVVRMLITLLMPTAGRASVAGFDLVSQPNDIRLRIGAALQDAALDPKQTGRELLRLQGRLYGISRKDVDTRLEELSSLVDIGDAIDRFIGTYSGGMKRRLDLAAALVHNPEVLFLDEPTTGLDPISRNRVWDEVNRINRELGVTIFLTTQYLEEADALAHRVGIINRGKLVLEGTPTALKRSMGSDIIIAKVDGQGELARQVLAGLDSVSDTEVTGNEVVIQVANGAASISDVALALARQEVKVDEIILRTPTLDDVFLRFTGARMEEEAEPEKEQALS